MLCNFLPFNTRSILFNARHEASSTVAFTHYNLFFALIGKNSIEFIIVKEKSEYKKSRSITIVKRCFVIVITQSSSRVTQMVYTQLAFSC